MEVTENHLVAIHESSNSYQLRELCILLILWVEYYGLNCVSKKICGSSSTPVPQSVMLFGNRVSEHTIREDGVRRESAMPFVQYNRYPYKKI